MHEDSYFLLTAKESKQRKLVTKKGDHAHGVTRFSERALRWISRSTNLSLVFCDNPKYAKLFY
ncbi:MAG: hypothetical protein IPH93_14115 [Saprospiraceae bacterium]|nr:hypothetical protein [Saprospiraceae bacterium]MBK7812506.1 hypothetical protein [Saprospiraceae bacterium]MBK9631980.1 hypothetical protein [Saprospiraceae bacterium]